MARPSDRAVELVALAEATRLLAGRGEASHLAVLVYRVAQPVDLGVTADRLVEGVHHDHLEELVGRVLRNPVRVEDPQSFAFSASTLL